MHKLHRITDNEFARGVIPHWCSTSEADMHKSHAYVQCICEMNMQQDCALACRLQMNALSRSGCCAVLCISGESRGCKVRFQTSKAFASTYNR